jgi:hypothetical protein
MQAVSGKFMDKQGPGTLEADRDRIQGEIIQAVFGKFME